MIVQNHICILLATISCFIKDFIDGNGFSYYDCQDKRKEMQTMEELIAMLEKLTVEKKRELIVFLRSIEEDECSQSPCASRQKKDGKGC